MLLSYLLIFSLLGTATGIKLCHDPDECYTSSLPYGGTPGRPFSLITLPIPLRWFVYTNDPQNHFQELFPNDPSGFSSFGFNFTKRTCIIIHGYIQHPLEPWINATCKELVKRTDVNCVSFDWSSGSSTLFVQAANLVRYAGRHLAKVLDIMEKEHNYSAGNVHIIGQSLGAHIAGCAGKFNKKIDRITGLDPGAPYFDGEDEKVRLSRNDARFVDVWHTNVKPLGQLGLGIREPIGDADYYPNGGETMPECPDVTSVERQVLCLIPLVMGPLNCSESFLAIFKGCEEELRNVTMTIAELIGTIEHGFCGHYQVIRYYIASIIEPEKYVAYPCHPLENCLQGISEPCPEEGCPTMGHHAEPPSSPEPQTYTLKTVEE